MDRRRLAPDEEVAPRAWAGLAVVAAALFVATLDAMVLYVAFGTIRRDFPDVSAAALSWILSGYTIVLAAGMIGAGRWADRLGRRRVFLAGMGVFTVASALCAVAPGVGVLVAARVLQGFGAAALTPASLALILRAFPKSRVPQAIALWGAAGALAAALGPTIGGLFVEAWGWRSVFVINVPIGIAVAILGRRLLDESREPDGSRLPDPVGTVVVTVALVLLALAIVQSDAWGWSSTRTVGALLGAVVLLGAFAGRCATVPNPVLPLDLFSELGFRWANLGQLLYGTGFTIMFFGNVQFLRERIYFGRRRSVVANFQLFRRQAGTFDGLIENGRIAQAPIESTHVDDGKRFGGCRHALRAMRQSIRVETVIDRDGWALKPLAIVFGPWSRNSNDRLAVKAENVRAGQVDRHFFSLDTAHSFRFFNRLFDSVHRCIRIDDHPLTKSTGLSLSDANDVE